MDLFVNIVAPILSTPTLKHSFLQQLKKEDNMIWRENELKQHSKRTKV